MSFEGSNINRLPTNLSTQIGGAGGVKKVLGDGDESAVGGVNPKVSEGATVAGNGKSPAAGQALLEMMSNPNGVVPASGFSNGKIEKKPTRDEATIETHAAALFADGTEADNQFKELMTRASLGAESSSRTVSPHEVELGKQAVIPLDGPDAQFKDLLRSAFRLAAGRHAPITKETIINSFHEAQE
jgi:hypothetical protein